MSVRIPEVPLETYAAEREGDVTVDVHQPAEFGTTCRVPF